MNSGLCLCCLLTTVLCLSGPAHKKFSIEGGQVHTQIMAPTYVPQERYCSFSMRPCAGLGTNTLFCVTFTTVSSTVSILLIEKIGRKVR